MSEKISSKIKIQFQIEDLLQNSNTQEKKLLEICQTQEKDLESQLKNFFEEEPKETDSKTKAEILNLSLMLLCSNSNITAGSLKILVQNGSETNFQGYNTNKASTLMALCLNASLTPDLIKTFFACVEKKKKKKKKRKRKRKEKKRKEQEKEQELSDKNGFFAIHYLCKNEAANLELFNLLYSNHEYLDDEALQVYCLNGKAQVDLIAKMYSLHCFHLENYNFVKHLLFHNQEACERIFPTLKFEEYYDHMEDPEDPIFCQQFFWELCMNPYLTADDLSNLMSFIEIDGCSDDFGVTITNLCKNPGITVDHLKTITKSGGLEYPSSYDENAILELLKNPSLDDKIMGFVLEHFKENKAMEEFVNNIIKVACVKFKNIAYVEELISNCKNGAEFLEFNTVISTTFNEDDDLLDPFFTNKDTNFHIMIKCLNFTTLKHSKLIYTIMRSYGADQNTKNKKEQTVVDLVQLKNAKENPQKELLLEILNLNCDFNRIFENDFLNYSKKGKFTNNCSINKIPVHKEIVELRLGVKFEIVKETLENNIQSLNITDQDLRKFLKIIYSLKENSDLKNKKEKDLFLKIIHLLKLRLFKIKPLKQILSELWKNENYNYHAENNPYPKDFKLLIKDDKSIHVHKFVLQARCKTFFEMFLTIEDPNITELKEYSKKSFESLYYFIKFLYLNQLENQDLQDITQHENKDTTVEEIIDSITYFGLDTNNNLKFDLLFFNI